MRGNGKADDACDRCLGAGVIKFDHHRPDNPDRCPDCWGKGFIVRYDDAEGIVWEGEPNG